MLKIRLQRTGKKGQAHFKIILTEHTSRPQGKYIELLGSYDPHSKKISAVEQKIKFWVSKGAKLSPTVNNLLVNNGLLEAPKMTSWKPPKKNTPATNSAATDSSAVEAAQSLSATN